MITLFGLFQFTIILVYTPFKENRPSTVERPSMGNQVSDNQGSEYQRMGVNNAARRQNRQNQQQGLTKIRRAQSQPAKPQQMTVDSGCNNIYDSKFCEI